MNVIDLDRALQIKRAHDQIKQANHMPTWWQRNKADLILWFSSVSITIVLYRTLAALV